MKAADEAGVQLWEVDLPAVDPALTPPRSRGAQRRCGAGGARAPGGTAPESVARQLKQAREALEQYR